MVWSIENLERAWAGTYVDAVHPYVGAMRKTDRPMSGHICRQISCCAYVCELFCGCCLAVAGWRLLSDVVSGWWLVVGGLWLLVAACWLLVGGVGTGLWLVVSEAWLGACFG